jgi:hypothetical protein
MFLDMIIERNQQGPKVSEDDIITDFEEMPV